MVQIASQALVASATRLCNDLIMHEFSHPSQSRLSYLVCKIQSEYSMSIDQCLFLCLYINRYILVVNLTIEKPAMYSARVGGPLSGGL